ncbi:MAG: hypothetical protein MUF20_13505 [Methylotetracoccus sp.]|jgi:hypothetical protein|nr:hypothetical protein [Methylotetracoccus sp.]
MSAPSREGEDHHLETIMENAGIYLVAWLLIAPIVGVLILSGLGSSRTHSRYDNQDRPLS